VFKSVSVLYWTVLQILPTIVFFPSIRTDSTDFGLALFLWSISVFLVLFFFFTFLYFGAVRLIKLAIS